MTESLLFYIFASLSVVSVLLLIFQSNPIASAMFLVLNIFGLAGLYVLLSATFVAALQILVYGGAVMVLFIFVIMLMDLKKDDLIQDRIPKTAAVFITVLMAIVAIAFQQTMSLPVSKPAVIGKGFGTIPEVGRLMFTEYLVPFELTSILLLVAIIGAVFLARRTQKGTKS